MIVFYFFCVQRNFLFWKRWGSFVSSAFLERMIYISNGFNILCPSYFNIQLEVQFWLAKLLVEFIVLFERLFLINICIFYTIQI